MAGCTDAARVAARRTLHMPIYPQYAKEFACVSGLALYNLFEYRRKCGIAASDVVFVEDSNTVPHWMRTSTVLVDMTTCGASPCSQAGRTAYVRPEPWTSVVLVRRTFLEYMERLHEALKIQPQSSLVCSVDMLDPIIASALECKTCSRTIYKATTRCAKVMESKIEEAIAKVELVVEA
ncbi:hypothetical protein C8T65DRAFT_105812 [Cerioporus squamosus]|nr:hypothetical protein C8T65DRAFT_105812 [Cerioporus squamosus]